jgi:ABC-type antimicrobial peptide transport system permease subunit
VILRHQVSRSPECILAQFLTESLMLSAVGGATGMLAALWIVRIASRTLPQGLLPAAELGVDSSVLFFALGITLASGLTPAWHAART